MKRYFRRALPLLFLLAAALAARADLVLVQKMESPFQNGTVTVSVKGDKVRTDVGKETTVIADFKAGVMTTLMHTMKTRMEMKIPDPSAALSTLTGKSGEAAEEALKPKPTGKKEKIAGHECEIMTVDLPNLKVTMWVAKKFPNYDKIKKEMEALNKAAGTAGGKMDPDGMVLKSVTEVAGSKITTTFVSMKQDPLDDAIFKTPADYREINLGQ